ncbi:glycosyltransferase [Candidatus Gottesmanbacteria bacterium]|nr:glycosyltransferase [Candidatus Gottesmanbacteria bacterium]
MTSKTPLVSIILPTLNEVENIVPLIKTILAFIKEPVEILVVDDHSSDGTGSAVKTFVQKKGQHVGVRLIQRTVKPCLAKSIQEGIDHSRGNIIVWMDSDFSMPPKVIPRLLSTIKHGNTDVAVASRFIAGGREKPIGSGQKDSLVGIVLSRFLNMGLRVLLSPHFYDWTSGFVAARRTVFRDIRLHGDYGEYFIDFIVRARAMGLRVKEIPYTCMPRLHGTSKTGSTLWGFFRHGKQYISMALQLVPVAWGLKRLR